eukprot:gene32560-17226_t
MKPRYRKGDYDAGVCGQTSCDQLWLTYRHRGRNSLAEPGRRVPDMAASGVPFHLIGAAAASQTGVAIKMAMVHFAILAFALLFALGSAEVVNERRNLWGPVGPFVYCSTEIGPLAAHECADVDNPCGPAACGPGSFVLESVACTGSLNTDKLYFIGGYKEPSYYNIKPGYCMNQYNTSSTGPTTMHTCMDVSVVLPGAGVNSNNPSLSPDACTVLVDYLNSNGCGDAPPGDLVFTCAMAPMDMDYRGRFSSVVTVCAEGYESMTWMSSITEVCASRIAAELGYPEFCDVYVAINNTCMSPVQFDLCFTHTKRTITVHECYEVSKSTYRSLLFHETCNISTVPGSGLLPSATNADRGPTLGVEPSPRSHQGRSGGGNGERSGSNVSQPKHRTSERNHEDEWTAGAGLRYIPTGPDCSAPYRTKGRATRVEEDELAGSFGSALCCWMHVRASGRGTTHPMYNMSGYEQAIAPLKRSLFTEMFQVKPKSEEF